MQIHPGAYVFYDAQQTGLGSCHPSEVAAKVKHLGLLQLSSETLCHTFVTPFLLQSVNGEVQAFQDVKHQTHHSAILGQLSEQICRYLAITHSSVLAPFYCNQSRRGEV